MKNTLLHSTTMSALILLTGCASYQASTLSMLDPGITGSTLPSQQNSDVLVSWKVFSKKDCQTYLGRDVLSEGYIPVQLTIHNNSPDSLYLSPNNFNIPLSSATEVANTVHTSTSGRVAVWGVGGLLFFPLLIPAFVDGFKSIQANQALDADYAEKSLKEQIIQPRSELNGIVFIPKEHANQTLEMFLINQTTHERAGFSEIRLTQ